LREHCFRYFFLFFFRIWRNLFWRNLVIFVIWRGWWYLFG